MSAFEISVTPPNLKIKRNAESKEPTIVVMAPFSSKAIVQFEDVPVGKTAKRILRIMNPSDEDIEVKVTKTINVEHNVTLDWTENFVGAGREIEMLMVWNPQVVIACKETLQLTDNRNFRKDVMIIFKSKCNQPAKNSRKFPSLSSGVAKATHIKTLRLKSPTGSNKISRVSQQHRKSTLESEKRNSIKSKPTNSTKFSTEKVSSSSSKASTSWVNTIPVIKISSSDPPKSFAANGTALKERNTLVQEKSFAQNPKYHELESSPFAKEDVKENVSPLTPGNVLSLIDNLNFTPATQTLSKTFNKIDNLALWPTPMTEDYNSTETNKNNLTEVRPRRLASYLEEEDSVDHSVSKRENLLGDLTVPNKTFEIKKTDTFNISMNESLEISNCDTNRLSIGPILNKTTTISSVHPMRALEMIQEEEGGNLSQNAEDLNLQKTYNIVVEKEEQSNLKRDIKMVGTPLRKYSESMKDLSLKSPKNKLAIQGSMPNLNEMETIRSIEQNRYFYQNGHSRAVLVEDSSNEEILIKEKAAGSLSHSKNSLEDSLNASTSSQASLTSHVELMFNHNEILAQSSRFNLNEVGLKSRKNSPVSSLTKKAAGNKTKDINGSPKSVKNDKSVSVGPKALSTMKRRSSLDSPQSDRASNESLFSTRSNQSMTGNVSPPKRLRLAKSNSSLFQKPANPVSTQESRQKSWSQKQPKKIKMTNNLSLSFVKKATTPKKENFDVSVKLYDSDLYLQACINPDPFAATTTCDPFLASTMYLDERSVDKHQNDFKKWLNALVTIPADIDADCNTKIDVGKLFNEVRNKDLVLAPTKEQQSMNYLTQYRLESLRRRSVELFMSEELRVPCSKVAVYINKNAIRIRSDRNLHLDVVMQRYILELLLCFNPIWLRMGLEVIYGERLMLQSNNDIVGLSTFILNRLFRNRFLEQKYSRAYILSDQYADKIKSYTLTKFLFLLLFLDKAKMTRIIKHNPCLFNKKSPYKETKEILLKFSSELLASVGDITRELKRLGYVLEHKQTYLDEFDYAFGNLAVDLRDGVRLTKVMEIIALRDDLTKQLRVPAISRLQRIFNVNLALKALQEADFHLKGEITAADIVDGHREKTLSLLWQIIYKFRSPKFHSAATTIQNFWRKSWLKVVIQRRIRQKEEMRKNKAATIIQAAYRGHVTRKFVRNYREECNKAATILQKYVRRFLAHKRFLYHLRAVSTVQRWYRATLLGREYRRNFLCKRNCAIFLQRIYRRRRLASNLLKAAETLKLQNQQKREAAAMCIQTFWRAHCKGKLAREEFLELRRNVVAIQLRLRANIAGRKQRLIYLKTRSAATKIQSFYRAYKLKQKARSDYLRKKEIVAKIQVRRKATLAMRETSKIYLEQRASIIRVQQRFKALREMKKHRHYYQKLKTCAIKIQRGFRAKLEMKVQLEKYQKLRSKVIVIQRKWRATLLSRKARHTFITLQYHTIVVQQHFRAQKEMQRRRAAYLKLRAAAICLQRRYRSLLQMRKDRERFLRIRRAAIVIQTRFKAYKKMRYDRARYRGIREATLCLQEYIRAYLEMKRCRSDFLRKREAAKILQKAFRAQQEMKKCRMKYRKLQAAAMFIQEVFRGRKLMQKQRKDFLNKRNSIIRIQKLFKAKLLGREVRKNFLKDRSVIMQVQRRFRSKLLMRSQRQQFEKIRLQIIGLQRRFRGFLAMRRDREEFVKKRRAAITLQRWCRSLKIVKQLKEDYQNKRRLIVFVQRKFKAKLAGRKQRLEYLKTLEKIKCLQRKWRATLQMRQDWAKYQLLRKSACVIQTRFRGHLLTLNLRNQYLLIISLVVSLQLKFRSFIQMKKERAEFLKLRQATIFCQRKYKAKLIVRQNRQWFFNLKKNVVVFQAHARGFLARERFKALNTPEQIEKRRQEKAARVIQCFYRGYRIRKRFHSIRLKVLRKNIKDLKESSSCLNSIRNKVQDAVSLLRGRFNASEALHVLSRLDRLSRTVPHLLMGHSNFISTFCYGIMAQTIRSEIDKQLIEYCSRIILNLARYNSTTANTFQESGLVTIAQMLLRWCDKDSEIFNTLCTLIWIFAQCPKKRKVIHNFMTTPEAIYMVRETKKLVARKEKMKQNFRNTAILSKNTKKNFSSRALPSLEPDYGVIQNQVYTFISSVYAFDTILSILDIDPF